MSARSAAGTAAGGDAFPAEALRAEFPALQRARSFVFFDNAAGAQVPQLALDAVNRHLLDHNVQRGGRYAQSLAVDDSIAHARASVAAFVGARRPEEIAFGMNATSFIRLMSLAIGQTLRERDEIIVTDLDHEANVATWLALAGSGAKFQWWKTRGDGCLHSEDLAPLLSRRTRLVACSAASNALGSITNLGAVAHLAHAAGAELFVDAVHFGPHAPLDVQALGCDYLVCSGYKIFAPHMGFMWGRYELLRALPTFREEFIADEPPGKIEAGTFVYENVAGMDAVVNYLARIGRRVTGRAGAPEVPTLREDTRHAMQAIQSYERTLSLELARVLEDCGARIYGLDDPARVPERVPTFCFNMPGLLPQAVTEAAARAAIGIRDGHMYAPRLMARLGLARESGAVRVSLVHYNTRAEIHRLGNLLSDLRGRRASKRSATPSNPI
jgi:cysteine desulfurase family protein (TIGR01976 family)